MGDENAPQDQPVRKEETSSEGAASSPPETVQSGEQQNYPPPDYPPPPPPQAADPAGDYPPPGYESPPPQYAPPEYEPPPPQYAPPGYQTPYPPPYAQAQVVSRGTNGFSIASLVLGILWLYWVGSILALIFGYVAKNQIDNSQGTQGGRGMAIAGIVLGWIGIGTLILVIVLIAIGASAEPY